MLTSARCRVYAKRSRALGKSVHIPLKRRTQALSMALKWTALAEGIDRDDAKLASHGISSGDPLSDENRSGSV
jgi:hypothetical protein